MHKEKKLYLLDGLLFLVSFFAVVWWIISNVIGSFDSLFVDGSAFLLLIGLFFGIIHLSNLVLISVSFFLCSILFFARSLKGTDYKLGIFGLVYILLFLLSLILGLGKYTISLATLVINVLLVAFLVIRGNKSKTSSGKKVK